MSVTLLSLGMTLGLKKQSILSPFDQKVEKHDRHNINHGQYIYD